MGKNMTMAVRHFLALGLVAVGTLTLTGCGSTVSRESGPEFTQKIRIEVLPQPTRRTPDPSPEKAECTIGDQHFAIEFLGGAVVEMPRRKMRLIAECPDRRRGMARAAIDPDESGRYPSLVQMRFGQNIYFKGPQPNPDKPAQGLVVSANGPTGR